MFVERVEDTRSGLAAAARGDVPRLQELAQGSRESGREACPSKCKPKCWDPHGLVDRHGSTLLMWAAGAGHMRACEFLLEECRVAVDKVNKAHRTALHWAVRGDHLQVHAARVQEMVTSSHQISAPKSVFIYYGKLLATRKHSVCGSLCKLTIITATNDVAVLMGGSKWWGTSEHSYYRVWIFYFQLSVYMCSNNSSAQMWPNILSRPEKLSTDNNHASIVSTALNFQFTTHQRM